MSQTTTTGLALDYKNFPTVLESIKDVNIHSYKNGDNGWFQKDGSGDFGQAVEYEYYIDGDNDNTAQYRTWWMETSQVKQGLGLIVSAKIDHIRGSAKDDHIILICGFDLNGQLVVAQATVQITSDSSKNLVVPPVTLADAGGDPGKIDDLVYDAIHAHDFKDEGRNTIAWLVKGNIISIRDSVTKD